MNPPQPDEQIETPVHGRVLAVVPFGFAPGYRVPVQLSDDPLDVVTLAYLPDRDEPVLRSHPINWGDPDAPVHPLACEVRAGDTLLPARAPVGRPNLHDASAGVPTPQYVLSVTRNEYTGYVEVVTRDGMMQHRRYRYDPEETMDFTRPRRRRLPRQPARLPEVFEGPFVSKTGAQFVFQQRGSQGGRIRKSAAQYDPELKPQFHPDTGDIIPYIVMQPGRKDYVEGDYRSPSIFSPTARNMPEVQYILRQAGLVE